MADRDFERIASARKARSRSLIPACIAGQQHRSISLMLPAFRGPAGNTLTFRRSPALT
jgi:hypothetical protein